MPLHTFISSDFFSGIEVVCLGSRCLHMLNYLISLAHLHLLLTTQITNIFLVHFLLFASTGIDFLPWLPQLCLKFCFEKDDLPSCLWLKATQPQLALDPLSSPDDLRIYLRPYLICWDYRSLALPTDKFRFQTSFKTIFGFTLFLVMCISYFRMYFCSCALVESRRIL